MHSLSASAGSLGVLISHRHTRGAWREAGNSRRLFEILPAYLFMLSTLRVSGITSLFLFPFLSPPNPLTHTDNPHTPSEELTSSPPTHTQTHTHPSASESEDCLFTMCMKCILECIISLPYGGDCDRLTHQLHGYNDYSQRDNHFTEGWGNYCEILHLLSKLLEKKVPKGRDRVLPRTHFDQKNPFWVLP